MCKQLQRSRIFISYVIQSGVFFFYFFVYLLIRARIYMRFTVYTYTYVRNIELFDLVVHGTYLYELFAMRWNLFKFQPLEYEAARLYGNLLVFIAPRVSRIFYSRGRPFYSNDLRGCSRLVLRIKQRRVTIPYLWNVRLIRQSLQVLQ